MSPRKRRCNNGYCELTVDFQILYAFMCLTIWYFSLSEFCLFKSDTACAMVNLAKLSSTYGFLLPMKIMVILVVNC